MPSSDTSGSGNQSHEDVGVQEADSVIGQGVHGVAVREVMHGIAPLV